MEVPLLDLKAQYATIRQEILSAVNEVLESQYCVGGPKVEELEKAIAEYCGCSFAVGVSSGTDAILNSLMSLGIGPGDEVITTPFTFFATAGCIARVGARAVFVDIRPGTFNIDTSRIGQAIAEKTKAILPVHLFGQMADMDPILEAAKDAGLAVIEDAAQSIGAGYKGQRAGSMGTCGCLSFYPSKNLGAAGDAGMILTNDADLAKKLRLMRNHGDESSYQHRLIGGNFRLDAIQAAVLLAKLRHLDEWIRQRQEIAAYYNEALSHCPKITTPVVSEEKTCVYNYYVIRVPQRNNVVEHLQRKKIGYSIYYPLSLHMQECFADWGYKQGDFPESENAAKQVLALPIYPELTAEQKESVVQAVLEAVEN